MSIFGSVPNIQPVSSGYSLAKWHSGSVKRTLVKKDILDKDDHSKNVAKKFRTYPLSLNDNGEERPLHSSKSSREFASAMRDVIVAHQHLYEDAQSLHGDICPNTIFINEKGNGVLVDWDHNPLLMDFFRTTMRYYHYGQQRKQTDA